MAHDDLDGGRSTDLAVVDLPGLVSLDNRDAPLYFVNYQLEEPPGEQVVMMKAPESIRAGAFRKLKNMIESEWRQKVLLVTSPSGGEGKTTCAVNLTLAMAETSKERVLLVEANWTSPSLSDVFGIKPPRCFSEQLDRHRDRPEDPWVLFQLGKQKAFIMALAPIDCACGQVVPASQRLCPSCGAEITRKRRGLDAPTFAAAIRRFRQAFDHIIIDGPPTLQGADIALLHESVDGALLVVKERQRGRVVQKAIDELKPTQVIGVVLME